MQLTDEIWKDIKQLDGNFQISNFGRVRSKDRSIHYTKQGKECSRMQLGKIYNTTGQAIVRIPMNNNQDIHFYIDELVIQHFTNVLYDDWKVIQHVDNDYANNKITNLAVIDPFEDTSETWKPIEGWEDQYHISNRGRLLRCPQQHRTARGKIERIRCMFMTGQEVTLQSCVTGSKLYIQVGRLVAQTFLQKDLTDINVVHIDGDKFNNSVTNLKLVSINDGYRVTNCIDENGGLS